MPIVNCLNNFVYFIKRKCKGGGGQLILQSQAWYEFDIAVSFTILTIIQVALSISEQLCRQTQDDSSFECGVVGAVLVTLQPQ